MPGRVEEDLAEDLWSRWSDREALPHVGLGQPASGGCMPRDWLGCQERQRREEDAQRAVKEVRGTITGEG